MYRTIENKNNFSFREFPVGNSVGGCANTIRVPQPEVSWEDSTSTRIADSLRFFSLDPLHLFREYCFESNWQFLSFKDENLN